MPYENQGTVIIGAGTNTGAITTGGQVVIWRDWVQSATTTCGNQIYQGSQTNATGSGINQVWKLWSGSSSFTITGTSAHAEAWTVWVNEPVSVQMGRAQQPAAERHIISPEERARRQAVEAEYQKKLDIERAARKLAEQKAEILLRQLLTPEQKEDLEKKNCFYLYSGDKKYRIDRGRTGNVKLVNAQDQVVESYCIHPNVACPDADTMLAQKLLLETDVETFERVANITARGAGGRNRAGSGLARAAH